MYLPFPVDSLILVSEFVAFFPWPGGIPSCNAVPPVTYKLHREYASVEFTESIEYHEIIGGSLHKQRMHFRSRREKRRIPTLLVT